MINKTAEDLKQYSSCDGSGGCICTDKTEKPVTANQVKETLEEIVAALGPLFDKVIRLESKVHKFERIFDQIFMQEAKERLDLNNDQIMGYGEAPDPLWKLKRILR